MAAERGFTWPKAAVVIAFLCMLSVVGWRTPEAAVGIVFFVGMSAVGLRVLS